MCAIFKNYVTYGTRIKPPKTPCSFKYGLKNSEYNSTVLNKYLMIF